MKFTAFVLATAAATASAQILSQNPFAGVNFGAAFNPYAVTQPLYNPYPVQQPYPIAAPRIDPLTWERDCTWINAVDFRNKLSRATCGSNLCTAGPNGNGGGHTRVRVRQMENAANPQNQGGFNPTGYHVWGSIINRAGRVCAVAYTGADLTKQFPYGRILSMKLANTANNLSLPSRAMPSHVRHFYPNNNRGLIMNGSGNSQYAVGGQNTRPGARSAYESTRHQGQWAGANNFNTHANSGLDYRSGANSQPHSRGGGSYTFNHASAFQQNPNGWTYRKANTQNSHGFNEMLRPGVNTNFVPLGAGAAAAQRHRFRVFTGNAKGPVGPRAGGGADAGGRTCLTSDQGRSSAALLPAARDTWAVQGWTMEHDGGNRNQGPYGEMGDAGSMHLNNEPELDEHSDTAWDVTIRAPGVVGEYNTIQNRNRHRAAYILDRSHVNAIRDGNHGPVNIVDNNNEILPLNRASVFRNRVAGNANTVNAIGANMFYPTPTMVWAAESSWFGFTLPAEQFNPGNIDVHYQGATSNYGEACGTTRQDPMCMQKPGGVAYSAGGLALYDSAGVIRGAIGVAGDNDCTNHAIAWKTRKQLNLDYVPGNKGGFADRNDEVLKNTDGYGGANQAIRNANALVNDYEVHWAGKGAEDNVIFSVKEHYMFPYCQALIRNFATLAKTSKNPLYAGV